METTLADQVAIITRTRDRTLLLERALQSVLAQTYPHWVHHIVNDGGDPDALDTLIEPLRPAYAGRLQVHHLSPNAGMQAALNHGIRASTGEYVAVHDDDDTWSPGFLEKTVTYLRSRGPLDPHQGVITHTTRVWESVDPSGRIRELEREPYLPLKEISLFRLGYENPFPPIAFLYRRRVHDAIGYFDQRFGVAGDMDFNFRFLGRFEIGVIPEPLAGYHWRRDSTHPGCQNSVTTHQRAHADALNLLKNHYLRTASSPTDAVQGLALNLAEYLLAAQWVGSLIHHDTTRLLERAENAQEGIAQLLQEVGPGGYGERFSTFREAFARLLDSGTHQQEKLDLIPDLLGRVHDLQQESPVLREKLDLLPVLLGRMHDLQQETPALREKLDLIPDLLGRMHDLQQATPVLREKLDLIPDLLGRMHRMEGEMRAQGQDLSLLEVRSRQRTLLQVGPLALVWRHTPRKRENRPGESPSGPADHPPT